MGVLTMTMAVLPAPVAAATPVARRGADRRHWALGALLVATGLLYAVGLNANGWANQYYSAAAQAGAQSWQAWLFGSLDAHNFITVDKPPASLWVMGLSVRLFGLNSWSLLVPQALEGVAAVALLYAAVRRVAGTGAGLFAGAALAVTPVATLMFRFDNPDALLVLLMTAAAYATVRAVDGARPRWLVLAGALLGFAFLTKMLQGLIVVPAFGLAYLVAAPVTLRRRVLHLSAAGAALVVSAGWYVALVELWPAGSRPYIGGSTDNSLLQLTFGYNGFGRLTGNENNGTPGGGGGGGFSSGQTGLGRLFGSEMGTQISWLLPAALGCLAALLWLTWRRPRTDLLRASAVVWGGWLLLTGIVFSYASGIIHPYYTVALAPAIAALVGLGGGALWARRELFSARLLLAGIVAVTALWTSSLLGRASWHPELRWLVLLAAALAVLALLVLRLPRAVTLSLLAVAALAAPLAYSLYTAGSAYAGALPTAGPSATGGLRGGPGRLGPPPGLPGRGQGQRPPFGGFPRPGAQGRFGPQARPGGGGPGDLGGAAEVSSAMVTALRSGSYTWAAAKTSGNEAASIELASGTSVMALGGFNGTDPAITLDAFQALVAAGKVHYYIPDGRGFIGATPASTSTAYQIQQWVESTFSSTTIGGTTVYDLSR
jgi:4-amino-4-deoxy-L-arabinose transferase-like glycosyltransferase